MPKIEHSIPITVLYSSPKIPVAYLENRLKTVIEKEKPNLIIGDFNIDMLRTNNHMTELSAYTQHVHEPTTDYNSLLYHVYSHNLPDVNCHILESHFSDHKPLLVAFAKK